MQGEPICKGCGNFIDDCACRCPYCGETASCECCCGRSATTGG